VQERPSSATMPMWGHSFIHFGIGIGIAVASSLPTTNCLGQQLFCWSTNCLLAVLLTWDGLVGFGLYNMLGDIITIVFLVFHSAHPKILFLTNFKM
jgi:hypothetical protein